ncbi:MAG: hypothetical protein ACPGUV_05950 [Polyangiales bacterium]
MPLCTLDALHLSAALFLVEQGIELQMASLDLRLRQAAALRGIPLAST